MILKDLYNELEKEALMQEPYAYSVKQTNQIIRKHFKMLAEKSNKHIVMQRLSSLGLGTHYCGWFKGYITIEGNEHKYDVMWTSGKNTHNPMTGNCISVEFTDNGIGCVFESAITMHYVRDENEKKQCVSFIEKKIERAYHKNVT